ncbi:hypothetical protein TRFO_41259 [Tritrichomonas foetus]|uniref:Importin N-terminal domain-containing protein n=1 Tax=Tritrichomonas foetus TaxID=1144522 RepID=A0A1J4L5G6_9EUKA|nr:hypothetical protein TRFO_41259 [Tritrichomonas foetus]|eukprot:OHT17173.1 hypothetical protein TRFO_41259 [Tritrichomonas foetus]
MDQISRDSLISLYTRLRDPTGQYVNEVTAKLDEFSSVPQSIQCFFEVISGVDDPVIKSYAVLGVRDYLIKHKDALLTGPPQNIAQIRSFIVSTLADEQNPTTRLQIINVISVLIRYFPGEWNELNCFLFTENFLDHLSSILQIMIHLFPTFSNDEIQKHIQYFVALIMAGFQSPDFDNNCTALSFFFLILIKINDTTPFLVFQTPLFELFQKIVSTGNIHMVTQFLEPISIGMNNNIIFFPLDKILPLILPILSSEQSQIEFKYPLNSLLGLYLQIAIDSINLDTLKSIFDLETQLVIQFYDLSTDDFVLSWIFDCLSVFEGIYMRIPEETVVQMSMERFQQLIQQNSPQFKLCAIAVLYTAMSLVPSNFSNLIMSLYPQLLNFLEDDDVFVQDFSSEALAEIACYFPDFITSNLSVIVQKVLHFIQVTGDSRGTHLLSEILKYITVSDELLPTLLPIILEWMRSPEPTMSQDAASIVCSMIAASQTQIPYFVEQITTTIFETLKENVQAHFPVYSVIEALCRYIPDQMELIKDQLVPIIMAGIRINDNSVRAEALQTIEVLPTVIANDPNFNECLMSIFTEVLAIARSPYDPNGPIDEQQLTICGIAIFQASVLCYYSEEIATQLPHVLSTVVYVAQMPSTNALSHASNSLRCLSQYISRFGADIDAVTIPTENMISLLIEKLAHSSHYEFSVLCIIISAIGSIIKTCGVEILKQKEIELIHILSDVLTQTMNPYTGALICPDYVLAPISELFIGIAFSTEGNTKEILDELLPILTTFLDHKSYQYQAFSIQTFAELISRNSTMSLMPDEMKAHLIQMMLKRITDAIPHVASAAANFIFQICKNEESVPLLMPCVYEALTALMTRLQSVTQLTTENILMRENILLAIASIGSYVLEDKFPVAETFPIILSALPIMKQFGNATCNEVYKFLNSMSYVVSEEQKLEYIRIYAWVIARSESQMAQMNIKVFILVNMGSVLKKFLDTFPPDQQQAIIAKVLNNDQYKMKCFALGYDRLRGMAHQIGST